MWMSYHRRSRPAALSPLRYESGKAERRIVRPLWGLTAGRPCAICYIIPLKKHHRNTIVILIPLQVEEFIVPLHSKRAQRV